MQDFLETPRFDTEISYGSSGGPGFKTYIFTSETGREDAVITWEKARATYSVAQNIRESVDMDAIRALFYACRGKAVGFRFKDWADYQLTDEIIGVGDGTTLVFRLTRTYGSGTTHEYVRRIFKPVSGTLSVKVDGVTVDPGNYSVSYTTGTITFGALNAPALDAIVTVTCEFDVPVRFNMDALEAAHGEFDLQSVSKIDLIEITLND